MRRAPVSTSSSLCWAFSFALVAPAAALDEEPRRMQSDECEPPYNACPNCCDIAASCECDFHCPSHPEVWAVGCSVPKVGATVDFVCPAGYTTCADCCDIAPDCACAAQCDGGGAGGAPRKERRALVALAPIGLALAPIRRQSRPWRQSAPIGANRLAPINSGANRRQSLAPIRGWRQSFFL